MVIKISLHNLFLCIGTYEIPVYLSSNKKIEEEYILLDF